MRRAFAPVIALTLIAAACGGDDTSEASEEQPPSTTIDVPFGLAVVESAGAPVELDGEIRDAVMDGIRSYVRDGVVSTLRTGEPEDLASVFDAAALAALDTRPGAAMLDRGAPLATGDITATAAPIGLTGLADGFGGIVLVSARVDLDMVASTDDGDLRIDRAGDLTFAPSEEGWRITAFRVVVTRAGAGLDEVEAAAAP